MPTFRSDIDIITSILTRQLALLRDDYSERHGHGLHPSGVAGHAERCLQIEVIERVVPWLKTQDVTAAKAPTPGSPLPEPLNKTPLAAGAQITCIESYADTLTVGKVYTVHEDERREDGWRVIRVTLDDGTVTKVPPQYFSLSGVSGVRCGCPTCFDRGFIQGGQERGAFIAKCRRCA